MGVGLGLRGQAGGAFVPGPVGAFPSVGVTTAGTRVWRGIIFQCHDLRISIPGPLAQSKKRTRGLLPRSQFIGPMDDKLPRRRLRLFRPNSVQKSTKSDAFFHCRIILDALRDGKLLIYELLKASYRILSV